MMRGAGVGVGVGSDAGVVEFDGEIAVEGDEAGGGSGLPRERSPMFGRSRSSGVQ